MTEPKRKLKGIADLYSLDDARRTRTSHAPQSGHDTETKPSNPSPAGETSVATEAGHAFVTEPDTTASHAITDPIAMPEARHDLPTGHGIMTGQSIESLNLLSNLPIKAGFLRLPNSIIDNLLPQLEPYEQIIYLQLYRLSHGNGKSFCLISMPKLARRVRISERSAWRAIGELIRKGLVEKGSSIHGKGKEQGITFYIATPTRPVSEASPDTQTGPVHVSDNKRKDLKENTIKNLAHADTKNCPDCKGTGFYYPDGINKGVVKCLHPQLRGNQ